mmetsp:Transcript_22187/g.88032  ORF Transcript_22187/g.88032 Transcript_22187/m.88032 type:complete len:238 (+) Transcript_22187:531-1244(+)
MGGVPASKRAGGAAKVVPSRVTVSIISPPPCQGAIASSLSPLPQRNPIPVGPHILWPEATRKSTPRAWTSTGRCGTAWQASTRTAQSGAPRSRAARTMSSSGVSQPRTFETYAVATILVRGVMSDWRCARSTFVRSAFSWAYLIVAPARDAASCHGTRFAWCSSTVSTISSPGSRCVEPQLCATRLTASVAPRVQTISRAEGALMSAATFSRAASYASVARVASVCAPRCTLELSRS